MSAYPHKTLSFSSLNGGRLILPAEHEARFWAKVEIDLRPGACWLWTAAKAKGYGVFKLYGKQRKAHQIAYGLLVGPIPAGLVPDHTCDTPACVNPAHIRPVTNAENLRRGRSANREKTHCPAGHAYDAANTYRDKIGRRYCTTCQVAMNRVRVARKRGR